jgi:hypothetical protein
MNCECACSSCTDFCDCQRCRAAESELLSAPSNRPGLDAIRSRIGDYGAFFTDAKRLLSAKNSPNLQGLGTRDLSDPTIAFLDAWSVAADVLTFYRERLTQEAYLRTATDELSLRELANMVGFRPRPGVSATAHIAYLLDPSAKPVDINRGAKVQTIPGPGEKMQTFETDEKLTAHAEWSQMKPRQNRPPYIDLCDALIRSKLRLEGTSIVVRPGERILFVFGMQLGHQVVREVLSAKTHIESGFVELTLKPRRELLQALDSEHHDNRLIDEKIKTTPTDKEAQCGQHFKLLEQLLIIRDNVAKEIEGLNSILSDSGADETKKRKAKIAVIIGNSLLHVISSYFLGTAASQIVSLLISLILRDLSLLLGSARESLNFEELNIEGSQIPERSMDSTNVWFNRLLESGSVPFVGEIKDFVTLSGILSQAEIPEEPQSRKEVSTDDILTAIRRSLNQKPFPNHTALRVDQGLSQNGAVRIDLVQSMVPSLQDFLYPAVKQRPNTQTLPVSVYLLRTVSSPFGAVAPQEVKSPGAFGEWGLGLADQEEGAAYLETIVDGVAANGFALVSTPLGLGIRNRRDESSVRLLRFAQVRATETLQRGDYYLSGKVTKLELVDTTTGKPLPVIPFLDGTKQQI